MKDNVFSEAEETKIKGLCTEATENLHAPSELYSKVTTQAARTTPVVKKRPALYKVALVVASLCVIVFGSNLIAYAATGTGWIGRILVAMNQSDEQEMTFHEETDANGRTYYVGYAQDGPNGTALTVVTYDPSVLEGVSFRVDGAKLYMTDANGVEHEIQCYDDPEGFTAGLAVVTPLPTK